MDKSPDAFRTISEVADWLGVQAHVLRFWESKFTYVKPVKRAGGRRYYRPSDMLLLGGIKQLLYEDGMTIKGVQKILREQGVAFVSEKSQSIEETASPELKLVPAPAPEDSVDLDSIGPASTPDSVTRTPRQIELTMDFDASKATAASADAPKRPSQETNLVPPQSVSAPDDSEATLPAPAPAPSSDAPLEGTAAVDAPVAASTTPILDASDDTPVSEPDEDTPAVSFRRHTVEPTVTSQPDVAAEQEDTAAAPDAAPALPDSVAETVAETGQDSASEEIAPPPPAPKPRIVDAPDPPDEAAIVCAPGPLTAITQTGSIPAENSDELAQVASALAAWLQRQTDRHAAQ